MGLKTMLSSYCTKRANNGVNLVTSRKINTRLARPIIADLIVFIVIKCVSYTSAADDCLSACVPTLLL